MSGAQLLPNLGAGTSDSKNFASSFVDFRGSNAGNSNGQAPAQTTSEILFLKRLLFLKASLDNESSVNNMSALPLGEEDAFARTTQP